MGIDLSRVRYDEYRYGFRLDNFNTSHAFSSAEDTRTMGHPVGTCRYRNPNHRPHPIRHTQGLGESWSTMCRTWGQYWKRDRVPFVGSRLSRCSREPINPRVPGPTAGRLRSPRYRYIGTVRQIPHVRPMVDFWHVRCPSFRRLPRRNTCTRVWYDGNLIPAPWQRRNERDLTYLG